MPDHFRLLFQAIAIERAAIDQTVAVAAERVPHERQIISAAGLRLPDMGHFVDEQALQRQPLPGKILGPQPAGGMEMDIAGRRHHHVPRLKRPPFAADDPHPAIVDRIPEHRSSQLNLSGGQRAGAFGHHARN